MTGTDWANAITTLRRDLENLSHRANELRVVPKEVTTEDLLRAWSAFAGGSAPNGHAAASYALDNLRAIWGQLGSGLAYEKERGELMERTARRLAGADRVAREANQLAAARAGPVRGYGQTLARTKARAPQRRRRTGEGPATGRAGRKTDATGRVRRKWLFALGGRTQLRR
jgi:hypothetical protein